MSIEGAGTPPPPAASRPSGMLPLRPLGLLLAVATAVLVVVSAVAALATSTWQVVPVAVLLELGLLVGLVIYTYALLRRSQGSAERVTDEHGATLHLGEEVAPDRVEGALVAMMRDAHAHQRGAQRFLDACARRLAELPSDGADVQTLTPIVQRQREQAAAHEQWLDARLRALGSAPSRSSDDEALVAAWLFEHVLASNSCMNARHAFALARLAVTSYTIGERLARTAGDVESERIMARCRADAQAIADAWQAEWESVLEMTARTTGASDAGLTRELIEQARSMEHMRVGLLTVTSSHEYAAAVASGTEAAGLQRLLDLIEDERTVAADQLAELNARMRRMGGFAHGSHPWETIAATARTRWSGAFAASRFCGMCAT
jgi:hypothetical protein